MMTDAANRRLELSEDLSYYTKMGDLRKLNQTLREATFLSYVKLDRISSLKVSVAEKKAASESAIINNVVTVAGSNYYGTMRLLQDLCVQLCQMNDLPLNPQAVYESIVCRMNRSVAALDAYNKLKKIVKASNLSLVRAQGESEDLPCEVEVFESNGELHANVSTTASFGLVRNFELLAAKGDINLSGFLVSPMKSDPVEVWVKFDVIISEKMNISQGSHIRSASVVV